MGAFLLFLQNIVKKGKHPLLFIVKNDMITIGDQRIAPYSNVPPNYFHSGAFVLSPHKTWRSQELSGMKKIYVGNLNYKTTAEGLKVLFSAYGTVHSSRLINDRETGKPRGFGFIEMDDNDALKAIDALNGKEFEGRALRINEAQEREPR